MNELVDFPFELTALAEANAYNRWLAQSVSPYLGERVIEVGAGIGNLSLQLPPRQRLVVTEADPAMLTVAVQRFAKLGRVAGPALRFMPWNLNQSDLNPVLAEKPDTLLSFNVLEHIEDDERALARMVALLKQSEALGPKRVVSFVPAHPWAYGEMDRAFQHYRRYTRERWQDLARLVAPEATLHLRPFNPLGLMAWWFNGRLRRKSAISSGVVRSVERSLPLLKGVDRLARSLRLPWGQSLIAVLEWDH